MRAGWLSKLVPPAITSLLAAAALTARPPRAFCAEPGSPAREARRASHLIAYVASDYGGAVRDGEVNDPAELDEQLTLLDQASASLEAASSITMGNHLRQELLTLRARAKALAPASDLSPRLGRLADALASLPGVLEPPSSSPSPDRGRALYGRHCSSCHGDDGQARTAAARELRPPPPDLTDPRVAEFLSPARVAMTVEMGIPGTAMVPVELGEQERWDVAFYASTLDHLETPPPSRPAPPLSLAELAMGTDARLREEMLRAGVAMDDVDPMLAELRVRAPFAPSPLDPLSAARVSLRRARALLAAGDEVSSRAEASAADEALGRAALSLSPSRPALARSLEAQRAPLRGPPTDAGLASALDAAARASLASDGGGSWWHRWAPIAGGSALVAAAAVRLARAVRRRR